MKKRLAEGMTLMVLLLVLWNMAAHTDRMAESQTKHFTAFFPTEGNSLEYGNIMKAKIAEVTGAECEELWLSGQTKEQALNSYIASGRYPVSYTHLDVYKRQEQAYLSRHLIALIQGKFDSVNLEYVKSHMDGASGIRSVSYTHLRNRNVRYPVFLGDETGSEAAWDRGKK